MNGWKRIAYAAACVVVPVAWGLLVVYISNRIERKIFKDHLTNNNEKSDPEAIHLDYHL